MSCVTSRFTPSSFGAMGIERDLISCALVRSGSGRLGGEFGGVQSGVGGLIWHGGKLLI